MAASVGALRCARAPRTARGSSPIPDVLSSRVYCASRTRLDQGCRLQHSLHSPGSPWENGYVESFNARLRDELLDGEIFYSLREAQVVVESWRRHYNIVRPHGSIGWKPPAPGVFVPAFAAWPTAQPRPALPAMLTLAPRPTLN